MQASLTKVTVSEKSQEWRNILEYFVYKKFKIKEGNKNVR